MEGEDRDERRAAGIERPTPSVGMSTRLLAVTTKHLSKRPAPAWLEPVDLGALASAIDTSVDQRSKCRRGVRNNAPSTSGGDAQHGDKDGDEDGDEDGEDVHAWMREALRAHMLDGEIESEVIIAEESLDALTACLGGILEKVLAGARGGEGGGKELTSLDIHKSIKSLFPDKGDGVEGRRGLRPYLPRMMKDAWKLDKASLPKGVKKRSGMSKRS